MPDSDRATRVAIGSPHRAHTFNLARQMEQMGLLAGVYTGYPRWKVDGLPSAKLYCRPVPRLVHHVLARAGIVRSRVVDRWLIEDFDAWASNKLVPCDVFHCISSFGLKTHRAAKERFGALTVCDRGVSHIVFQNRIVSEEQARWGLRPPGIDPRVIERELAEYEICDLIVVPSAFAWRSFVEMGVPEAKLRINPLGADLTLFRPAPKADKIFRVIYVGTLSLQKGIPYLLEALAPLNLPNFELWLIGHVLPEVRPILARFEDRFRALGPIPRVELYRYYSQGSVLVLPSIQDGFGMVQAQAMACGLPVIATTNTGGPDLFTDGVEGFVVPIRDPEAIRQKVLYLYEHPEARDQMAAAALRRVRSIGGWDTYGERAAAIYARAMEPSVSPAGSGFWEKEHERWDEGLQKQ